MRYLSYRDDVMPGSQVHFTRALLLVLLWSIMSIGIAANDSQTGVLKVGASISPHPCQYPERCKPPPAKTVTKLSIQNGVIRYVGSPPQVDTKGDLITIRF